MMQATRQVELQARATARRTARGRTPRHPARRAGLTLIELLVVLVILAALSTVALRSTAGMVEQSRYEADRQQLDEIRDAILGPVGQRDSLGNRTVTGFIADVGRLPQAEGADPLTQLEELWANPNGLTAFSVQTAPGDGEVQLACGWRGPYLQLPLGTDELRTGWGNPLSLLEADESTVANGDAIEIVQSLGADDALGGTDYNADLSQTFEKSTAPTVAAQHAGTVSGYIYELDGGGNPIAPGAGADFIIVRVYGPVAGALATIAQFSANPDGNPFAYTLSNVPIGPRIVRAYRAAALPATDEDTVTATAISIPQRVTALAGGTEQDLIIEP